jgi:hypothetical protein
MFLKILDIWSHQGIGVGERMSGRHVVVRQADFAEHQMFGRKRLSQ